METQAIKLLDSLLNSFSSNIAIDKNDLRLQLIEIFSSSDKFLKKISLLDEVVSNFKIPLDIGEILLDLLLFNFFNEDGQRLGEQYFESKEWRTIEDALLDRGTELMNILLYLQECKDAEIQVSIDDYLDEYLMDGEDFESDDSEVYEAVIKNRDSISDGNLQTMLEISEKNSDSELQDQLLPILFFFESHSNLDDKQKLLITNGKNPEFQNAFLSVLCSF